MNKYIFIIIIFTILISSCDINNSEDIIKTMNNELKINKNDLFHINKWIDEHPYNCSYTLGKWRHGMITYIELHCNKQEKLEDYFFAKHTYSFLVNSEISYIVVYEDVNIYSIYIRNKELSFYKLLYIKQLNTERYKKYKNYEMGNVPEETSGWMYHLEDDWYLLSPFPKNKKK